MVKNLSKREIRDWFLVERPKWKHRQPSDGKCFSRRSLRSDVLATIARSNEQNSRAVVAKIAGTAAPARDIMISTSRFETDEKVLEEYRTALETIRKTRQRQGYRPLPGGPVSFPYDPVSHHIPPRFWVIAQQNGILFNETIECRFEDRDVLETVIRETVNQAKQWWTFVEQSFTSRVTFMFAGESDALVFKMTNSQFLFDAS